MKVLKFSTEINAPREKVWEVLWKEGSYKKWTKVFSMIPKLFPNGKKENL